ncbi:hypothetical protein JXB12_04960 [candidate division KSB1 bacterium]|nr:hypothetical protein [candidate division KSB1 bacterium]
MKRLKIIIYSILTFLLILSVTGLTHAQQDLVYQISINGNIYPLYPETINQPLYIPSPYSTADGVELVDALLKDSSHALIPVTVEHGKPLIYSYRVQDLFGKDNQLHIDSGDFPTLARTGLHSEKELNAKEMITGYPVSLITYIGRPGRFSYAGFMAEDEDIITVLKSDNRFVQNLGLTHPQLARPLFHVWNLILKEIELGKWARHWDDILSIQYNQRNVTLKAQGTKGWQVSIFQDEIQGRFDIHVHSDLSPTEQIFINDMYSHLSESHKSELVDKLTNIHFSEMAPYYIMRYGFYEGHTDYRTDPIAIAFIFGLKSLNDIDHAFENNLHAYLTNHFADEKPTD